MAYSNIPGMAGMADQSFNPAFAPAYNVFNPAPPTTYRGAGAPTGGGVGMAAGGGAFDAKLAKGLKAKFDEANAANEARFQKMLALAGQFGASQSLQAQDASRQQLAGSLQGLTSRGLGNSTVRAGVEMSAASRLQGNLADIADRKNALEMGVYQQHQEIGPDLGMYAQLFSAPRTEGNSALLQALFGGGKKK